MILYLYTKKRYNLTAQICFPHLLVGIVVIVFSCSCRCPYYVSRELHKVVDILFAPYNYLIDRGYRKSLSVGWNNSILIFDEAHNLVQEIDSVSFYLFYFLFFFWKNLEIMCVGFC